MKTLFLSAFISLGLITGKAEAQQLKNILILGDTSFSHKHNLYLNDINIRAVRDFTSRFADASDAEWIKTKEGYAVVFVNGNIRHRSFYNFHGDWIYTLKYYSEQDLPRDVRAVVKSRYYDYNITLVVQVDQVQHPVAYIVHLEDADSCKIISVCDGEMNTVQEFHKG